MKSEEKQFKKELEKLLLKYTLSNLNFKVSNSLVIRDNKIVNETTTYIIEVIKK